ncbi:MAG: ferrous iron transport protein B [Deltaproteobacteria bacterium]|nr:ferrous iron transport protein B [Deltaproteobacteria bacterium]
MSLQKTIALIGNPNTGKTTLFNALTGLRQRVGNYPGVTVERKSGTIPLQGSAIELIDLPGTYSLAAQSPDEMIAVDLLLGQQSGSAPIDGVIVILDATNLQRNCYLLSQILECGLPILVVLNMIDAARKSGIRIDVRRLSARLGVPVVETCARTGEGIRDVLQVLCQLPPPLPTPPVTPLTLPAALATAQAAVAETAELSAVEALRVLVDTEGYAAQRYLQRCPECADRLAEWRRTAANGTSLAAIEASSRYTWIRQLLRDVVATPAVRTKSWSDRLDAVLTHKIWGTLTFSMVTILVFQSIYAWAGPLMDCIDWLFGTLGTTIGAYLPRGALRSLIVDGIIGGVGSVLVFLPQILFLFLFIAIMEDCGYMARAAFLMDRLLSRLGLSGKSFIPLLSSFACAIPGIMATRTIEDRRDRLVTIMVAPLMSCSARLPVYTILIAAFIPAHAYLGGWLGLQGIVLFAAYSIGLFVAIPVIWLLKRTLFRAATPAFVMELPPYKWPSLSLVGHRVYERGMAFVRRAGTIIFAMTIVVWALSYFPRPAGIAQKYAGQRVATAVLHHPAEAAAELARIDREEAGAYLRASAMGHLGQWIEPVVKPLGWDWRIGMATLASFPAREVIIAVLGTIYNLGDAVDETSAGLQSALRTAHWPDGRLVFSIPVALSIMVFFALCCQCGATVATIRRETNSWQYAWLTFGYMTILAYGAAFLTYRATEWFLG